MIIMNDIVMEQLNVTEKFPNYMNEQWKNELSHYLVNLITDEQLKMMAMKR